MCAHCEKAGVYVKAIAKLRPDQYLVPPLPQSPALPNASSPGAYTPAVPMRRTPPRSAILASCVPEPPENEVLEWTPTEERRIPLPFQGGNKGRLDPNVPPLVPLPSSTASQDEVVPHTGAASIDDLEPSSPVCLTSGKLLDDLCPLCDGMECPSTQYDQVDITMDSGAGAPVANPKDFPGCEVTDSPGSLAGQMFVGPDGS